jgi:hypothetical protein
VLGDVGERECLMFDEVEGACDGYRLVKHIGEGEGN